MTHVNKQSYETNKVNIIFLDVDGVLNTSFSMLAGPSVLLDPNAVQNLNKILLVTDTRIVLSTMWRKHAADRANLKNELYRLGVNTKLIIDQTPDFSKQGLRREDEIKWWVTKYNHLIRNWVAIDDLNLSQLPKDNFIHTNMFMGLSNKQSNEIISKFIFSK